MAEKSNEAPRKMKAAIAIFESSGQPQEGALKPRTDNIQNVAKTVLLSEAERAQNGMPRPKNPGLVAHVQPAPQTSQLKKTGAEHCTDQNDFRAHLKPAKCKPNRPIALDIDGSAGGKTEKIREPLPDNAKVAERMACSQGLKKLHTGSQGKASEFETVSLKAGQATPGKDFRLNLAKVIAGQNSPTQRTVIPSGLTLPRSPPTGKLSTDTTQSKSSTLNSPSVLKGAVTSTDVTPELLATRAQRKPPESLPTPKPPPGASGSASNHSNLTKTNIRPPLQQKGTSSSSQTTPDSKPVETNKLNKVPLPPMPKTGGQNWKVTDLHRNDASGNWNNHSTQSNPFSQIISVHGNIYRLLPPPAVNRDTCPRKPRRPPSVDLTQFMRHTSGANEISSRIARSTAPAVPPAPQTNSRVASVERPVSLIPEWTEEDEAMEASFKAAQQRWVADSEENYEISNFHKYANDVRNWRKQTEEITETHSQISQEEFDAGSEMADASDDSDYENIDSYKLET